jgi:Right handed beta helix region
MNKFRFTISALAIALFALTFTSAANAQATRTWVSGVGDDANPCSRTAPCKTFAGAISKTATGGEIDALDPGGFGALNITGKSITIDGGGGIVASVLASGTSGITFSGGAGDTATLINLRFQGILGTASPGTNAIRFLSGKALNVINCDIYGWSQNGIDVALNQASLAQVFVRNTVVKNCTGDGISIANTGAGPTKFVVESSSFTECGQNGLHAKATTQGTARNSVFSLNGANGVFADAVTGGSFAVARVWSSQISGNGQNGVVAGNGGNAGTSVVEISQDQIDQNVGNGALVLTGGTINTFTNNSIQGNGTNGCPSCTGSGPGN